MTTEEIYIKHIECGIRAIKLKTKNPQEANVGKFLNKLKEVNEGLYEDYIKKYQRVVQEYKINEENLAQLKKNSYLYRNKY